MKYRLLIDYEVIEFMERLSRKDQRLLRNRFVAIRDYPRRFSDYTQPDSTGRAVDIHICGKYAIKFWEDHSDQHVKILDSDLRNLMKMSRKSPANADAIDPSLPARDERGESRREGLLITRNLLSPALSSCGGGEGEAFGTTA